MLGGQQAFGLQCEGCCWPGSEPSFGQMSGSKARLVQVARRGPQKVQGELGGRVIVRESV